MDLLKLVAQLIGVLFGLAWVCMLVLILYFRHENGHDFELLMPMQAAFEIVLMGIRELMENMINA